MSAKMSQNNECEPKLGEIFCKKRTNEHLTQSHLNIKGGTLIKKTVLSKINNRFLLTSHIS